MHMRCFLWESEGFGSYADKLFIRTWTSSSLISVLVHVVRGKERQGESWGRSVKQCVETWWSHWRRSSSCPCNYSEMSFASGRVYLINVIKSKLGCFRERGSLLIHLSTTIIDCPRCARSGVLAANKHLNQDNNTIRSMATAAAIICHRDDRADSVLFLLWAQVEAPCVGIADSWLIETLVSASSLMNCDALKWLRFSLWKFKVGQWRPAWVMSSGAALMALLQVVALKTKQTLLCAE